jgi:uncharacterized radical SAM superfamily Fe-S cluster-containing enzyme
VLRRATEGKQTVWLRRRCPEHAVAEVCISSDARFYWLAKGDPRNGCACSSGDGGFEGTLGINAAGSQASTLDSQRVSSCEKLSTCLALIEIVNSCNLACPTCYADSPRSSNVDAVPLADLKTRIQGVIDRKGPIEILQLSGGEPTLHPHFFELLSWCHVNSDVDYVLLNTNGLRIATDDAFADQLGKAFRYGRFQLYLQFDGPQESGQHALRAADLRGIREKAIQRCADLGIPLTLAMTVTPQNLPYLWKSIEYGLRWPNVRGITFQPLFTSGRTPVYGDGATRLNTADIILGCVEQSRGVLDFAAFTPLPCGDPNCATIGYLLRTPAGLRSISDFVDFAQVQSFLRDKVRYSLDDLAQCGCESEPLGRMLHDFELNESSAFRLFIKPFMDASTWDEDRIDRCCTHVIRPDGALDSFCRYYAANS